MSVQTLEAELSWLWVHLCWLQVQSSHTKESQQPWLEPSTPVPTPAPRNWDRTHICLVKKKQAPALSADQRHSLDHPAASWQVLGALHSELECWRTPFELTHCRKGQGSGGGARVCW